MLQWDEATLNKVAWCCIILNCMRMDKGREREVLSTTKLRPDNNGHSKTGANIGSANAVAVSEFDVPCANIDYCCSDTTSSNSSLNLPKAKGGSGGEGGAYAHLWADFRRRGHILVFMLWCLSHLGNNECAEVMQSCG